MEIEQVAHEAPDKVAKVPIDAMTGVDEALAREIVTRPGSRPRSPTRSSTSR